jgi:uncharacterized membrane protein
LSNDGLRVRPSLSLLVLAGLAVVFVVGYPIAVERALGLWGTRGVGACVLALGLASFGLRLRQPVPGFDSWLGGLVLALPALAALTADARFLKLVPAGIEGLLCVIFLRSLRGGGSLLRDAARVLEPHAPDFIGPYCRKATAAFAALFAVQALAALFAVQALALAALALAPPERGWAMASSLMVWVPTLIGTTFEFMVRKVWFRHYGDGPIDRVLRTLLPSENTAQGRRSMSYVRAEFQPLLARQHPTHELGSVRPRSSLRVPTFEVQVEARSIAVAAQEQGDAVCARRLPHQTGECGIEGDVTRHVEHAAIGLPLEVGERLQPTAREGVCPGGE